MTMIDRIDSTDGEHAKVDTKARRWSRWLLAALLVFAPLLAPTYVQAKARECRVLLLRVQWNNARADYWFGAASVALGLGAYDAAEAAFERATSHVEAAQAANDEASASGC